VFIESGPLKHSVFWSRALELDQELGKYDWPSRTSEAEKYSFALQCDKHKIRRYKPSFEELNNSKSFALGQYLKHELPRFWHLLSIESLDFAIEYHKMFIKPDSTPGVPYSMMANRNDKLLEQLGTRFNDLVISRIYRRLEISEKELRQLTRQQMVDLNLMDPVRVFVKSEPHKKKKLEEGRVRLIMSVSIVDKMIEMLLCRHLYKKEIANWETIPSKPGIGFDRDGVTSVYNDVMTHGNMCSTDISGWDWNVDDWQIIDEADCVIDLCVNPSREWAHILRNTAIIETKSIYQFSDGQLVQPIFEGVVNSGKFKTSRGNSFMRTRLAFLIGANKCIAAGDDTVETFVDDAVSKYAKFGFEIKEYQPVVDTFEFCSRLYGKGYSYPVNSEKILMNLLHNVPHSPIEFRMYMTGFLDDLEDHPQFQHFMELVERVGYIELAGAQEVI